MGKTIEELFKTKQLSDGKTAEERYDIRNSKDIILRSSTGAMDLPFKIAQIARRNLSSRLKETRLEEEVTGVKIIAKAGAPIIYGTDIFKLSTQKTEMVTEMKNSVNPNNAADNGLLGNLFQKGKEKGLELLSKIGVQLPTKLIPTRVSLNPDFKAGKEPDTMKTLAKIKGDGAGNLVGKLLAQNVKGTPKQIGNQVLGAGIKLLKGEVKKKLFGAPKQGAQNLAKKGETEVQYDSSAKYSDTINPFDDDYLKRNDLSSILVAKDTKVDGNPAVNKKIDELVPKAKDILNTSKNPFAKFQDKVKDVKGKAEEKLSQARKQGQQALADGKKIGDVKTGETGTNADAKIKYSETVDEAQGDIKLRNDLSTKLDALNAAAQEVAGGGASTPIDRKNSYSKFKNSEKKTLRTKLGIDTKVDFLNEKVQYTGESLTLSDNTKLDDYDFIPFKFYSVAKNESINFRATLTGVSETVSPSWDSAKFIGSPFNYYTYSGIERSLAFNFKIYSTSPKQHIAAWQKINYLTGLAYPQVFYKGGTFAAPFIRLTIGNLYKAKDCFIESLSYTVDDNGGWEIGSSTAIGVDDDARFTINGETTSIDNYKLPTVIDVSVTVKLVESKSNVIGKNYYGFDKLPRAVVGGKAISFENTSTNPEIAGDSNNAAVLEQLEVEQQTTTQPKENVAADAAVSPTSTPSADGTTETKKDAVENTKAPEAKKIPSYRVTANVSGDSIIGNIYADGKLAFEQSYWSGFSYNFNGVQTEGAKGVELDLKWKCRHGFYDKSGNYYEANENVN